MEELSALDGLHAELLADKYVSSHTDKCVSVQCSGTPPEPCSGAAFIVLSIDHWSKDDNVGRQMALNRQQWSALTDSIRDAAPLESLCLASLFVEQCVHRCSQIATNSAAGADGGAGAQLFYSLVQLVNEDTNGYPATKQLLSTCIEILG